MRMQHIVLSCLVHLNVPLLLGLQALEPLIIVKSLLLGNTLKHVLDSGHHSLQSAEVDVGTVVQLLENLVGVLLNLVLDVHLAAILVGLLTGKSVVETEVVRVVLLDLLPLVVVEEGVAVGNTKEQPGLALVGVSSRGVLGEQTADESTVRGDTGSGGNHDEVGLGVLLRHEHDLSGGSSHLDLGTRLGVAQEVGADSLLGGIVGLKLGAPVGGATNAKGSGLSGHVITVTTGGDGVEADRMGLSVLLTDTRGDDSPRLALPVREVSVVVDDNVASLTGGLGSDNALGGDNLSGERGLVLVDVDRDSGLVPVRLGFKEVLLGSNLGSAKRG